MIDEIDSPLVDGLNAEGLENKPVCPVCQSYLENAEDGYDYKRLNADTRWFWCDTCEGHLGYHRMKKRWKVDPYDLQESAAFRAFFGVDGTE
jgi:hypothetical protein